MSEQDHDASSDATDEPESFEALRRIEIGLSQQAAGREPRPGWQAGVFARIAEREASREPAEAGRKPPAAPPRKSLVKRLLDRWTIALPTAAAFAAVTLLALWPRTPLAPALALAIHTTHRHDTQPTLAAGVEHYDVGDTIEAVARGGGPARALWIYRNDRDLVLVCPGDERCQATDSQLSASFTIPLTGNYHVLAMTAQAPIPAPNGTYATDLATAQQAGAQEQSFPVD
jgi:hypothetical protein